VLVDVHAPLDMPELAEDLAELVARASERSGVALIITAGTNLESSRRAGGHRRGIPTVAAAVAPTPTSLGLGPPVTGGLG